MYDPYNPYYGYNISPTPTTPVRSYNMTVPVVSGRAGAEAFRMEANSSIFLMDDSGEMARDELKHANYLKEIGQKMISENEMSAQCKRAWISTVEFLLEKEKMVHEMLKTSS